MTRSDPAPRGWARPSASLLVAVGVATGWAVAAALRPDTTYHLVPVIVMGAYPVLRWSMLASRQGVRSRL